MATKVDVLVVDDDIAIFEVIALLLDDMGLRSVHARNGREGLERAIALHPRLILTDLMMPDMRGDEMIDRLRDAPELRSIPIIMMTSAPSLRRTSVHEVLTKPFDLSTLEHIIVATLAS